MDASLRAEVRVAILVSVILLACKQQAGGKQRIHRIVAEPCVEAVAADPVDRTQRAKEGCVRRIDLDRGAQVRRMREPGQSTHHAGTA